MFTTQREHATKQHVDLRYLPKTILKQQKILIDIDFEC